ncbi:MAG: oligopeptide transporter, OPT family [Planctomycetota bacterium]
MNDAKPPLPPPLVPSERSLAEITVKAVILGVVLAVALAAANAYLGLKVGMTVAASIPAAAVSLGVLRAFGRTSILENNMVQTIASAGASTVSGVIFTVPALVMMGAWKDYDYWTIVLMVIVGGAMGVAFTVPLRRALIVDVGLQFPEGVATSEVLKSGGIERGGDAHETPEEKAKSARGFRLLVESSLIGAGFKLLEGGARLLTDSVAATKAFLGGKWLFTIDATLAPSLLGIGYIVGLNVGVLILMGAVIGTIIGVPVNWMLNSEALMQKAEIAAGTPWDQFTAEQWEGLAGASWGQCRRIGVGCMIVGGLWSLVTLVGPLVRSVRMSLRAYKAAAGGGGVLRTERDTPFSFLIVVAVVACVPLYLAFSHALGDYPGKAPIAALMTAMMLVFGFLFSSVAGYMAGLVGSSNNPVSGVTMATVIASSLTLVGLMGKEGIAAQVGPIAVIYLAAFICVGCCIAGDNLQDLKCGHVVGATPWKQQACLVVGAIASAFAIPWVLGVLDQDTGIGRPIHEGVTALSAPQATLMKEISTGIFGQGLEWIYVYIGFGLAVLLILLDQVQKARGSSFRFPVLAVAVGIYLPFGLSVLIFTGAVLNWLVLRVTSHDTPEQKQDLENNGMLLASGLITGEALMGVLVPLIVLWLPSLRPAEHWSFAPIASLVAVVAMALYLYRRTLASTNR